MKIIKRNGSEETFDIQKIVVAVTKADKDNGERTLTDRLKISQNMWNSSVTS